MSSLIPRRHVCVAPLNYVGKPLMQRDVDNFLAALAEAGHPVEDAFLPVVAPTSISVNHTNEYYPSHEAYLEALADALHEEYRTITDAGLIVQLDDAILTHWFDRITDEGGDYRKWVEQQVEVINHALRGIPEEQVRYHVCWGSWPGPHTSDVPFSEIADLVMKVNAQAYSIEAANPRHEWEWTVWQDVKLPDGKILLPGVISHAISHVEHPELDRATPATLRRPGRARERDRQQRLRLRAGRRDTAPGAEHHVGQTQIARRGSAPGFAATRFYLTGGSARAQPSRVLEGLCRGAHRPPRVQPDGVSTDGARAHRRQP